MDKIIVTVFLVMAGVISSVFVFNSIYPAIVQSGDAMTSMERRIDERMKSQIQIVSAVPSGNDVAVWVKNIGSLRIAAPEACDVFFGPQGNFERIPYGVGEPNWTFSIENDDEWNPTATLRILLVYPSPRPSGIYFVKFVLPNGISNEYLASW